jgi:hypothetical protein
MPGAKRSREAALALVAAPQTHPGRSALFCGHCAKRASWPTVAEAPSRVCQSCGLGLLLECDENAAPDVGAAFIVIDSTLSVCAVSAAAERLLATPETDAVNRHVTELVVPADAEAQGAQNLAVAITWAARGDDTRRKVVVRPSNTFGIRIPARIATCGPPRAAIVVFE